MEYPLIVGPYTLIALASGTPNLLKVDNVDVPATV
jgi:hypothetical protein